MSEPLEWDYPHAVVMQITVGDQHIDGLGHTNNCEYLKWCEEVAWHHSKQLGLDIEAFQETGYGMAATHTELDYLMATYAGEELAIGTWIIKTDKKIYTTRAYQIIRLKDQTTVLRGFTKFVCVNLKSGRLSRMPERFKEAYLPVVVSR